MQLKEFLTEFQDLLQRDDPLSPDSRLEDLDEWDSLAIMAVIAWFDKRFGRTLNFGNFKGLQTVADVAALSSEIR